MGVLLGMSKKLIPSEPSQFQHLRSNQIFDTCQPDLGSDPMRLGRPDAKGWDRQPQRLAGLLQPDKESNLSLSTSPPKGLLCVAYNHRKRFETIQTLCPKAIESALKRFPPLHTHTAPHSTPQHPHIPRSYMVQDEGALQHL